MYSRPPITEAVIDIRVENPPDEKAREKLSRKFEKYYPNLRVEEGRNFKIEFGTGEVQVEPAGKTFRRSSYDEDQVLLLTPEVFAVSHVGLYPGWNAFYDRFLRDWQIWRKDVGYRKISRIGLRTINRIDVPIVDGKVEHEKFVTLSINLPEAYPDNVGFQLTANIPLPAVKGIATVQSAIIDSPVPGFAGVALDIDLSKQIDLPQKDEELFDCLAQMRLLKNDLFESFITEEARGIFTSDQPLL